MVTPAGWHTALLPPLPMCAAQMMQAQNAYCTATTKRTDVATPAMLQHCFGAFPSLSCNTTWFDFSTNDTTMKQEATSTTAKSQETGPLASHRTSTYHCKQRLWPAVEAHARPSLLYEHGVRVAQPLRRILGDPVRVHRLQRARRAAVQRRCCRFTREGRVGECAVAQWRCAMSHKVCTTLIDGVAHGYICGDGVRCLTAAP